MSAEVDALNVNLQDVAKFIESSNTTAAEVDAQLKVITAWMRDNNLESVPPRMTAAEAKTTELAANFGQRCRELTVGLEALQASAGPTGASSGFQGAPFAERDRNVFDNRDYKLADLQPQPSLGKWKKWRRDLEAFVDTIGHSWKGTSGLMRELRHREVPFEVSQVSDAIRRAEKRGDKSPAAFGFDYDTKKDVPCRLLMPRLDEVLSN